VVGYQLHTVSHVYFVSNFKRKQLSFLKKLRITELQGTYQRVLTVKELNAASSHGTFGFKRYIFTPEAR
jgi:hypothetical protein